MFTIKVKLHFCKVHAIISHFHECGVFDCCMFVRFSCHENDHHISSLLIAASPTIDPDYVIPNVNRAVVGSNATLSCSYLLGSLPQYYSVSWYIGSSVVDLDDPHYGILPNISLSIYDVRFEDDSKAYFCKVCVHEPNDDVIFSEYGYDTTLMVYGMNHIVIISNYIRFCL